MRIACNRDPAALRQLAAGLAGERPFCAGSYFHSYQATADNNRSRAVEKAVVECDRFVRRQSTFARLLARDTQPSRD
jgi:hypothetical protein